VHCGQAASHCDRLPAAAIALGFNAVDQQDRMWMLACTLDKIKGRHGALVPAAEPELLHTIKNALR